MKRAHLAFFLLTVMLTHVLALGGDGPRFSGYVRNYTAVLAKDEPEFAMLQNTANLSLEYRKDKVGLKITPWVYHYPRQNLEIGLRETLTLDIFAYVGLYEPDALIRPRATYDLTDGFSVQLGANIFAGDKGKFGQFDDNDMVYLKTRFRF